MGCPDPVAPVQQPLAHVSQSKCGFKDAATQSEKPFTSLSPNRVAESSTMRDSWTAHPSPSESPPQKSQQVYDTSPLRIDALHRMFASDSTEDALKDHEYTKVFQGLALDFDDEDEFLSCSECHFENQDVTVGNQDNEVTVQEEELIYEDAVTGPADPESSITCIMCADSAVDDLDREEVYEDAVQARMILTGALPTVPQHDVVSSNPLYKSKLCIRFIKHGKCEFGEGCDFAHGADELRSPEIQTQESYLDENQIRLLDILKKQSPSESGKQTQAHWKRQEPRKDVYIPPAHKRSEVYHSSQVYVPPTRKWSDAHNPHVRYTGKYGSQHARLSSWRAPVGA